MIDSSGFYGADETVAQLVRQIPRRHNIEIFQKVTEPEKALWYVRKTLENGWSRNVLAIQIDSRLYERQSSHARIDNFAERLPAPGSDLARESLEDPYVFDFLDLGEEARERKVEESLVEHLARFMLELGKGFAFVGEQVKAPEDNPSIGLILCRDRDNLVAEYALRDLAKPIGVSCYELAIDPAGVPQGQPPDPGGG